MGLLRWLRYRSHPNSVFPNTVQQINVYLAAVERVIKAGGAIAVHCGGGKGMI